LPAAELGQEPEVVVNRLFPAAARALGLAVADNKSGRLAVIGLDYQALDQEPVAVASNSVRATAPAPAKMEAVSNSDREITLVPFDPMVGPFDQEIVGRT
jgi:hypothetical protein